MRSLSDCLAWIVVNERTWNKRIFLSIHISHLPIYAANFSFCSQFLLCSPLFVFCYASFIYICACQIVIQWQTTISVHDIQNSALHSTRNKRDGKIKKTLQRNNSINLTKSLTIVHEVFLTWHRANNEMNISKKETKNRNKNKK